MKTLYDRINAILGRYCPALGGVSGEAISVIRELEERLEDAFQVFQDIADATDLDSPINDMAYTGMDIADSVADYKKEAA